MKNSASEVRRSDDVRLMLGLVMTPGVGPVMIGRLREHFGSIRAALSAPSTELCAVRGISQERARAICTGVAAERIDAEIDAAQSSGAAILTIDDERYPKLLRAVTDAPPVLYVRGTLNEADAYAIAIVGTRDCSAYGRDQAGRLSAGLAQAGLCIVSGGARGIDTEAHHGALRGGGRTLVVMGCGLQSTYPPENEALFERIVQENRGVLVSEFSMGTKPSRENFPRRNRIISGLSLGTLVVEADERSGALITARLACEDQNREVLAIPGRADSNRSAGCHKMIREGWARLVTGVPEILDALKGSEHLVAGVTSDGASLFKGTSSQARPEKPKKISGPPTGLTESQQKIYGVLSDGEPIEVGELAARTGLAVHILQADLTMLQIRGVIANVGEARVGLA